MSLSVIDISAFSTDTAAQRAKVATAVAKACEQIGFLIISGHGVTATLVDEAFASAAAFFDQPVAVKERWAPAESSDPRGYHRLGTKNLAKTLGYNNPPDLREQFYIGPLQDRATTKAAWPDSAFLYAPNIWPSEPACYRPVFTRFYTAMESLGQTLMRIFATSLQLDEHYFDASVDRHFSTMPANDYPALDYQPLPEQLRCGEHSDFGSLTILAIGEGRTGLQVRARSGQWIDVQTKPGEFVVNIGDMLQRWTNDRWHSTIHRVVNPAPQTPTQRQARRMSIGYFLHPNYDASIACLPTCHSPDTPPRYPAVLAGELMQQKMKARTA